MENLNQFISHANATLKIEPCEFGFQAVLQWDNGKITQKSFDAASAIKKLDDMFTDNTVNPHIFLTLAEAKYEKYATYYDND